MRMGEGASGDGVMGMGAVKEGPARTVCLHQSFQHRAQCLVLNWFSCGGMEAKEGNRERGKEGARRDGEQPSIGDIAHEDLRNSILSIFNLQMSIPPKSAYKIC